MNNDQAFRLLKRAIHIAFRAHMGATDKVGQPYIGHPLRVMARMDIPEAMIVAVLHDVVEDTEVTLDELANEFPMEIVEAVDAISKREGENYWEYIARCARNPLARAVKYGDMADNSDPARVWPGRTGFLEKYARARTILRLAEAADVRPPAEPVATLDAG